MGTGLATYYDRLGRWNRVAHAIGHGGGSSSFTVHRALADPRADGRATFTRLHDILVEELPSLRAPRLLDAGCGLGGTMFAAVEAWGATCTGLTLSASQARTANAEAARRQLSTQVRAIEGTYDLPPRGPFDVIVAIESLAHSPDPAVSVAALAAVLAPGGTLVVVDDMPVPGAEASDDLGVFKAGWQCPVLWSEAAYREAFTRASLEHVRRRDLSADCRPRSTTGITALLALNHLARRVSPGPLRQVLASHRGGLALERLSRAGLVRYTLLIARRPELQVS
jgi:SAM-dependent methyltransferase